MGTSHMFKVGDKVRCVDRSGWKGTLIEGMDYEAVRLSLPSPGHIYVRPHPIGADHPAEIPYGFAPRRFELVEDPAATPSIADAIFSVPQDKFESAMKTSPFERQVGGDHYKDLAIQPIDYILANGLGFLEGNVVKYITRYSKKGGSADVEKAKHYCELLLAHLSKKDTAVG